MSSGLSPPRTLPGDRRQEVRAYRALVVDVPADAVGSVIEKIGSRKGEMLEMNAVGNRMKLEFLVPAGVCSATATNF